MSENNLFAVFWVSLAVVICFGFVKCTEYKTTQTVYKEKVKAKAIKKGCIVIDGYNSELHVVCK